MANTAIVNTFNAELGSFVCADLILSARETTLRMSSCVFYDADYSIDSFRVLNACACTNFAILSCEAEGRGILRSCASIYLIYSLDRMFILYNNHNHNTP